MVIKQNLLLRKIVGEYILVPTGAVPDDQNGLFVLTEWGAFIWGLLEQGKESNQILHAILEEYEVDEPTAKQDLDEFLGKLKAMNVIE